VVVCLLFLTLSIYFFVDVSKVVEVRQKYYSTSANPCLMGMSCDVRFSISEHMSSPIYFMYELGTSPLIEATSTRITGDTSKARTTTNWQVPLP
jgi:hypothetical protein